MMQGGGGVIPPRIDLAGTQDWTFFRADGAPAGDTVEIRRAEKHQSYREQAALTIASEAWDGQLRLWGTQMIERTAAGGDFAITDPSKATAVRINMHLHIQTYYDQPEQMHDTDEDWED